VKPSKGAFCGNTRRLKGKSIATVSSLVRTFNIGDKVIINPRANWVGMPHLRFTGKHAIVVEKRGKSYVVELGDYNQKKRVIAGPVHLKLAK